MKPLTMISLCAGMDGFAKAAHNLGGFQVLMASEISLYKRLYLKWAYGVPTIGDLTKHGIDSYPYADIYVAGTPCQDTTNANSKGKGVEGQRSGLVFSVIEIVGRVRPRVFILENSPNIVNRGLERVLGALVEIGYDAEWCVLRCKDFGLPQKRSRFFLVSYPHGFGSTQVHIHPGANSQVFSWEKGQGQGAREGQPGGLFGGESLDEALASARRLDHGIPGRHIQEFLHMAGNAVSPRPAEYILNRVQKALAA